MFSFGKPKTKPSTSEEIVELGERTKLVSRKTSVKATPVYLAYKPEKKEILEKKLKKVFKDFIDNKDGKNSPGFFFQMLLFTCLFF